MKERSDFVEVEFKFLVGDEQGTAVELYQQAAPPGSRVVQKPATAFFDLYLDSIQLDLHQSGMGFRLRFDASAFRKKGRYRSNFKTEHRGGAVQWLSRREVRTDLARADILPLPSDHVPGLAAELAYEAISLRSGAKSALYPTVLISSLRRYYTMRAPVLGEPDLMLLAIERSVVMDARGIDVDAVLQAGVVDWSDPPPHYELQLGEIELTVEHVEEADEVFHQLIDGLCQAFPATTVTKYEQALARMGIRSAKP